MDAKLSFTDSCYCSPLLKWGELRASNFSYCHFPLHISTSDKKNKLGHKLNSCLTIYWGGEGGYRGSLNN